MREEVKIMILWNVEKAVETDLQRHQELFFYEAFLLKERRPRVLTHPHHMHLFITCSGAQPPSPAPVSSLPFSPGPEPVRASLHQSGLSGLGSFS